MPAQLLDGRALSNKIIQDVRTKVDVLLAAGKRPPCLAMVLVGEDPASAVYVGNKRRQCAHSGIVSQNYTFTADISEAALISLLTRLNSDEEVDGILVQLPLPGHIDTEKIIETIHPSKDVDGLHPYNMGRLAIKQPIVHPCTPHGIMALLRHTGIDIVGQDAVIVGASNIVGRPMALELLLARATTTVCHSKTKALPEKIGCADILIVGVGVPRFVEGSWIKEGAVVIDVGINRQANGELCGDVEFDIARERASWMTPVPGGVGPMTVAMLMENTLEAFIKRQD